MNEPCMDPEFIRTMRLLARDAETAVAEEFAYAWYSDPVVLDPRLLTYYREYLRTTETGEA